MTARFLKRFLQTKNFQILKYIVILFVGWRLITIFIAYFGLSIFPFHQTDGSMDWANQTTDFWVRWANWDGGHFRGIAENGYINSFQVVFFPLYPLMIRMLSLIGIPSLWSGLLISNLSLIAALFFLYKLVLLNDQESTAKKAVLVTLAFPTAFYFGTAYSESLFLFLVVASFYYARKKSWLTALILAGFASVTRLIGLSIIAAIGFEYFLNTTRPPTVKEFWSSPLARGFTYITSTIILTKIAGSLATGLDAYLLLGLLKSILDPLFYVGLFLLLLFSGKFFLDRFIFPRLLTRQVLFFLLSLTPFLIYCLFLYFTQGDFFAFIHHEQQWHRHLSFPWTAPLNYFNRLWPIGFFQLGSPAQAVIELMFFVIFFLLFILSYFKLRISYTLFFAAALFIPIATGTLQAIHRYGLIIFPAMILLAKIKNEEAFNLWLYFCLMLQGLLLVLFFNGYWVT